MRKCAVLLSGGINYSYNYKRYKNDLYLAYNVLKNIGDFSDEDIFLFYGNGTGWFEDTGIIPYAAEKLQLLNRLEDLEHKLDIGDEFVLVVSNHGGNEQEGNICLWGLEYITLLDLSKHMNKIKAKKIIILGECFAGNILKYEITNSCIFTANKQGEPSYAGLKEDYDEFLYHFFSYILGKYPDTKIRIPYGNNNLLEAYEYAKKQDRFSPENERKEQIVIDGIEIMEVPQIKNNLREIPVKF